MAHQRALCPSCGTICIILFLPYVCSSSSFIDCIRIVSLPGSRVVPLLLQQLDDMDMLDSRVQVQYMAKDPREGAGCWQQHVRAWENVTASKCNHSLILEEDAVFIAQRWRRRSAQLRKFVDRSQGYDTLQLGMWYNGFAIGSYPFLVSAIPDPFRSTSHFPIPGSRCIARSIGEPGATHAYIISARAAAKWRPRWGETGTVHIDQWMKRDPDHENYAALPSMVFQRIHVSQNMKNPITKRMEGVATGNTRAHALLERRFFYNMDKRCWHRP